MHYKMHVLVLNALWSILVTVTTAYAGDFDGMEVIQSQGVLQNSTLDAPGSNGVRGCTGKLVVTPPFKKGDIE